jgi:hypothetical protein
VDDLIPHLGTSSIIWSSAGVPQLQHYWNVGPNNFCC